MNYIILLLILLLILNLNQVEKFTVFDFSNRYSKKLQKKNDIELDSDIRQMSTEELHNFLKQKGITIEENLSLIQLQQKAQEIKNIDPPYLSKRKSTTSSTLPLYFPVYKLDVRYPLYDHDLIQILLWLYLPENSTEIRDQWLTDKQLETRWNLFQRKLHRRRNFQKFNSTLLVTPQAREGLIKMSFTQLLETANNARRDYWKKWVKPGRTPRTPEVNSLPTDPEIKSIVLPYTTQKIEVAPPQDRFFLAEFDYYYQQTSPVKNNHKKEINGQPYKAFNLTVDNQDEFLEYQQLERKASYPDQTEKKICSFGSYLDDSKQIDLTDPTSGVNCYLDSNLEDSELVRYKEFDDKDTPSPQNYVPLHLEHSPWVDSLPPREERWEGWNRQRWWQQTLSPFQRVDTHPPITLSKTNLKENKPNLSHIAVKAVMERELNKNKT